MWRFLFRAILVAAAAAALPACARFHLPAPPAVEMAIVGVDVIPMTDSRTVLRDRTVLLGGGRILWVGPREDV